VPLTLLAGPANAGKVSLLLDRYTADIARNPVLVVPNRAEVGRVEQELVARGRTVLGGTVGTFDDVFESIARGNGNDVRLLTEAQRALVVRRVASGAAGPQLGPASRFSGFAETLAGTLSELESGLVEPEDHDGGLAALQRAYRGELERRGLRDREGLRRYASDRLAGALDAWDGRPVYAYGFEDLTGVEWALLRALAGRTDVTVSLPYEPGRVAFLSLEPTAAELAQLADGRIEELPPASDAYARPPLAFLERSLYTEAPPDAPRLEGAVRFLEAAGARGALELVADEILALLRSGTAAESIAVVCPSVERRRSQLETSFGALGIPYAVEGRARLSQTPFGSAMLSLLRFAWLHGGRRDLYAFMRSPYSGLRREHVDFLEGRLRGRAVRSPVRVEEETLRLRGQPLPFLDQVRSAPSTLAALRKLAESMLRAAHGLERPPDDEAARLDLRTHEVIVRLTDELERWLDVDGPLETEEVVAALEQARVRVARPYEAGRVAVLDLLAARTRHYDVVFLLGFEEGTLPRRAAPATLLDDDARRDIEARSRRARLQRPDPVARDRYLVYTACTRARRRLYLVREAATEDGSPREPSPFWTDIRSLFDADDVARWTTRRPLSHVVWPVDTAPSERERIRAAAALGASDPPAARALARANGWERRVERALTAFSRPTRLTHADVLHDLSSRMTFGVTELEVFAECSSMWFVERIVDPRPIDGKVDARLRGQVAHQALFRLFSTMPKRLGTERVEATRLEETLELLHECVRDAVVGQAANRLELTDVQRLELEQTLLRDLGEFVRDEAAEELPLVPRRFEVLFGTERSAPELKAGLDLGGFHLSGKIDRIDLDPFSARGIVQDYKSGKKAHSAAQIESELRLQIPLYMLVLRDLVGVEPIGGLYRALAGERSARGLLRATARADGLPGFSSRDYLDDDDFWAVVDKAVEHARGFVGRIRAGDVVHDPKGGFPCPSWCERAPMCRVRRP
jgi:ATP-dependent helicase/nuclease subunit B